MKTKSTFLIFMLLSLAFVSAPAQVSNTRANLSAPGQVTITYNLKSDCPIDVVLYYSLDKCDWLPAATVTGALVNQSTGNNKTILWNSYADNARFGKFFFKVEKKPSSSGPAVDPDEYVLIGGTKWATRNVAAPGAFAATPESPGMFYQWSRNIGWSATVPGDGVVVSGNGEGIDSDGTAFSGATWDETNPSATMWCDDPCPSGWRLPTQSELETLQIAIGSNPTTSGTWDSTNKGVKVSGVDKNNAAAYLFLPAAGYRDCKNENAGALINVGSYGYYWSNKQGLAGNTYAYSLRFTSSSGLILSSTKTFGLPIRCVAEL